MRRSLLLPLAVLAFSGCERPTEPVAASDSPVLKRVSPQSTYEIVDLGTLGGDRSYAYGIDNRGQIVGSSQLSPGRDSPFHAFLWERGEMTDLGTLGGDASGAGAINNRGQIVGSSQLSPGRDSPHHAFLWERGLMTDLGDWHVNDINDRGQIVGCAGNPERAILWHWGEMTDLGTLGGNSSCAEGINNRGQVVGTYASNQLRAFLWDRGEMTDLGTLGGEWSAADAINDRGQVVGASVTGCTGAERQNLGVLWERGVMTVLGTPGVLGGGEIYVLDINNRGQAVGYAHAVFADYPYSTGRAHLWENGEIVVLGTLGGLDSHANGINNRGQIVGSADTESGDPHATLWRPKRRR